MAERERLNKFLCTYNFPKVEVNSRSYKIQTIAGEYVRTSHHLRKRHDNRDLSTPSRKSQQLTHLTQSKAEKECVEKL